MMTFQIRRRIYIKEYSFRSLVIDEPCALAFSDDNILIRKTSVTEIPICQIKNLIIHTNSVTITSALMNALSKHNVQTIFCDEKHNPSAQLSSFSSNVDSAGKIMDQCKWKSENKQEIWQRIVFQKIRNQEELLRKLNLEVPPEIEICKNNLVVGDKNNCEAIVAKLYFNSLFGTDFKRHFPDDINSALNYGYILILSSFNRILTMHGYNTAIGINHCNRKNSFNLSCDLMEPFRPFIDRIVYENRYKEFNWEYKKQLIESLYKPVYYGNKEFCITDAFENYSLDVLKGVADLDYEIKEIYIA